MKQVLSASPWLGALLEGVGLLVLAAAIFAAGLALVGRWRAPTPVDQLTRAKGAAVPVAVRAPLCASSGAPGRPSVATP